MLFTLEAVEAKHGDSLLLHYGTLANPKLILIDGGPDKVYGDTLRPRLDQLRASRVSGGTLPFRMVMVSHIDEDHIIGILAFTKDMLRAEEDNASAPYSVTTLWHNSFDDLVKEVDVAALTTAAGGGQAAAESVLRPASTGAPLPPSIAVAAETRAILASVLQGRDLRNNARKLAIKPNTGFTDLVKSPDTGVEVRKLGNGLSFTIIGPRQDQLDELQNDWAKTIAAKKKAGKLKPANVQAIAAEFVDDSIANLSSIVVLAKSGTKTMLLTGDARGDFIIDGLKAAKLMPGGKLHVDLFKLPHHGSVHNVTKKFFTQITADHYVISANGRDNNPDTKTLEHLFEARPNAKYTLHLTNHVTKADNFINANRPPKVTVRHREDPALSIAVDLGDPLGD